MKYPVVNLYRMGSLLEEYERENQAFKEKLNRLNQESAARWAQEHPGPVYTPPQEPGGGPEKPLFPPQGEPREFPYRPPTPTGGGEGMPPPPGVSVTGGIPGAPPTNPPLPPVPTGTGGAMEPCDPGYSHSPFPPYPCVKNVASTDRYIPGPVGSLPGSFGAIAAGGGMQATSFNMGGPMGALDRRILGRPLRIMGAHTW